MGLGHGGHGSHAAIDFKGAALVDFHFAGAFFGTGKQAAQHHSGGTGGDGLCHIAGILDTAICDDADAMLGSFVGTVCHGSYLGHADACHHPCGADGAGADAHLDTVCTSAD